MGASTGEEVNSVWLASNRSKRWGKLFFLLYSPVWLTLCLGIIVPYKLYEDFKELEYLIVGSVSVLPAFLIPIFIVGKADSSIDWKDRYWVKVRIIVGNFSYSHLSLRW